MASLWSSVVRRAAGKTHPGDVDALQTDKVNHAIEEFNELFKEDEQRLGHDQAKVGARKTKYATMVNHYYDLVTDFYEYGWGQCFHFAPRFSGEDFHASLARHEHFLALKLGLRPGMTSLDLGCGVGGPMRAIARYSGATVIGVNNNDYQIKRSNVLCQQKGLAHLCSNVKGDFMNLPFPDNSVDRCYAIEATCHAPDKVKCFSQMHRVLKPGGLFAGYEWIVTDKYNPKDEKHRTVKHMIEHGDSLPDLATAEDVKDALVKAGFEIVEAYDVAVEAPKHGNDVMWWSTLEGGWTLSSFRHSKTGRFMTQKMVDTMETLRIAPKGTSETHKMLCIGADGLVMGGSMGIFSPMYYFLARKK